MNLFNNRQRDVFRFASAFLSLVFGDLDLLDRRRFLVRMHFRFVEQEVLGIFFEMLLFRRLPEQFLTDQEVVFFPDLYLVIFVLYCMLKAIDDFFKSLNFSLVQFYRNWL